MRLDARPTRAQFKELVASGALRIDEYRNTAKAVIRPYLSGKRLPRRHGIQRRTPDWSGGLTLGPPSWSTVAAG